MRDERIIFLFVHNVVQLLSCREFRLFSECSTFLYQVLNSLINSFNFFVSCVLFFFDHIQNLDNWIYFFVFFYFFFCTVFLWIGNGVAFIAIGFDLKQSWSAFFPCPFYSP